MAGGTGGWLVSSAVRGALPRGGGRQRGGLARGDGVRARRASAWRRGTARAQTAHKARTGARRAYPTVFEPVGEHGAARGRVGQRDVEPLLHAPARRLVQLLRPVGCSDEEEAVLRVGRGAVELNEKLRLDPPRRVLVAFRALAEQAVDLGARAARAGGGGGQKSQARVLASGGAAYRGDSVDASCARAPLPPCRALLRSLRPSLPVVSGGKAHRAHAQLLLLRSTAQRSAARHARAAAAPPRHGTAGRGIGARLPRPQR